MRPGAVYRIWNEAGVLIYVGTSTTPFARFAQHRAREWWPQATRIDLEWFPSSEEARRAESRAIAAESPIFNVAGRSRYLPLADGNWRRSHLAIDAECPNCRVVSPSHLWLLPYQEESAEVFAVELGESTPGVDGWAHSGWAVWHICSAFCHPYAMRAASTAEVMSWGMVGGWVN
jgi:hypothetical protein